MKYITLLKKKFYPVKRELVNFQRNILTRRLNKQVERIYSGFDHEEYEPSKLRKLPNESSICAGEIMSWARDVVREGDHVLLVGEDNTVKARFVESLGTKNVTTIALQNADCLWNFEEKMPLSQKFDCIISQAMLEHLLNPYKHLIDLSQRLAKGGHLIVHSVSPQFAYHRHPIDTLRFFPDWFEEMGERMKLTIVRKKMRLTHLFYVYKKEKKE